MEKQEFPFPSRLQALSLFVSPNSYFLHAKGSMSKPWNLAGVILMGGRGGQEGTKSAAEVPWVDVWTDGLLALPWWKCAKNELFMAFTVVQNADTEMNLFEIFVSLTNNWKKMKLFLALSDLVFFCSKTMLFSF